MIKERIIFGIAVGMAVGIISIYSIPAALGLTAVLVIWEGNSG